MNSDPGAPASQLTKREHFIAMIASGLCSQQTSSDPASQNRMARDAIKITDLLFEKLNSNPDDSIVSPRR